MSILTYFKPKDGLPNPKGPLSLSIPSQAIALANREIAKATTDKSKKRGPYKKQVFANCCRPYFLINMVASNTAGSFELFHDLLVHVHCGPSDLTNTRFKNSCQKFFGQLGDVRKFNTKF